jgi:hypothetical protein
MRPGRTAVVVLAEAIKDLVERAVGGLDDLILERLRRTLARAHDIAGGELVRRADARPIEPGR